MMKTLLSVLSIVFTLSLTAQSLDYLPAFSTISEELDLTDVFIQTTIHAELANNLQADGKFQWFIVPIDGAQEWGVQLSVNSESGGSFPWNVLTNINDCGFQIPLTLADGETSIMELSIRPNGVAGCGRYEVRVADINAPDDYLSIGVYEFKINSEAECLTATSDSEEETIKLYPNPTDLSFKLNNAEDLKQIRIINAVGKEVLTSSFTAERSYDISNLTSGLYFVQAQDENGQVLKTLRLIKK